MDVGNICHNQIIGENIKRYERNVFKNIVHHQLHLKGQNEI